MRAIGLIVTFSASNACLFSATCPAHLLVRRSLLVLTLGSCGSCTCSRRARNVCRQACPHHWAGTSVVASLDYSTGLLMTPTRRNNLHCPGFAQVSYKSRRSRAQSSCCTTSPDRMDELEVTVARSPLFCRQVRSPLFFPSLKNHHVLGHPDKPYHNPT